ncbi:MAG: VOC family protein [Nitrospirae bacterium]|nr:VOC family protein [Nitrospirota bacterium]
MRLNFHHIGIACSNIGQAREWIRKAHGIMSESAVVYDPEQDAELCILKTEDGSTIELISGRKVENLVNKGISYYHICYSVPDIEQATKELVDKGAMVISGPKIAVLFDNKRVSFLFTPTGIVELLED